MRNLLVLVPQYLLPLCKSLPSFLHLNRGSSPDASTVKVVDVPVATDLLSGCRVILGASTMRKKRQFLTDKKLVVTFFFWGGRSRY